MGINCFLIKELTYQQIWPAKICLKSSRGTNLMMKPKRKNQPSTNRELKTKERGRPLATENQPKTVMTALAKENMTEDLAQAQTLTTNTRKNLVAERATGEKKVKKVSRKKVPKSRKRPQRIKAHHHSPLRIT